MRKRKRKTKTNRKHKDSLFTFLFGEKKNTLELYNAIKNTNYGMDTDLKVTTLRNALVKGQQNDISFVLDGKIVVLMEHQSTINNNMPLRMLQYITRNYERIVKSKSKYLKEMISIPKPEFIVDCPPKNVFIVKPPICCYIQI